jgi:hypothetical protein
VLNGSGGLAAGQKEYSDGPIATANANLGIGSLSRVVQRA